MRNTCALIFCTLIFSLLGFGRTHALEVSISSLNYFQEGAYLEIYSRIMGNAVRFNPRANDQLQANVELLVLIKSGTNVAIADKYNLESPIVTEASDFYDRRRYTLENGDYTIELQYVDLNNTLDTLNFTENIKIKRPSQSPFCSDILLMNNLSVEKNKYAFNKAGFSFEPLTYNLYDTKDNQLYFYTEFYQLDISAGPLYCKYYIMDADDLTPKTKPAFKKLGDEKTFALVENFEIKDVPTGNYVFVLEIVDKEKSVKFYKEERFAVYHPVTDYRNKYAADSEYESSFVHLLDEGEVNYALKAIFPKVGNNKTGILNDVIWGDDFNVKKYFLYDYWSQYSSINAKPVYEKYMEVARAIDMKFANNVGHGFETDRGYIFLKYGKPDDYISVEDEPSAPPYEIWVYNHVPLTNQTNVKFLFYNQSLVTNDFTLLHSTCRGEIANPRWEIELYRDDTTQQPLDNAIDARQVGDGLNRNARRYFTDM